MRLFLFSVVRELGIYQEGASVVLEERSVTQDAETVTSLTSPHANDQLSP